VFAVYKKAADRRAFPNDDTVAARRKRRGILYTRVTFRLYVEEADDDPGFAANKGST
jgi:hypothetical protein